MDAPIFTNNKERTMNFQQHSQMVYAMLVAVLVASPQTIAQQATRTDHFNTLQTISYVGESDSFQQNLRAIVRSTTIREETSTLYRMAFEGGITYPSSSNPTVAASEAFQSRWMTKDEYDEWGSELVHVRI